MLCLTAGVEPIRCMPRPRRCPAGPSDSQTRDVGAEAEVVVSTEEVEVAEVIRVAVGEVAEVIRVAGEEEAEVIRVEEAEVVIRMVEGEAEEVIMGAAGEEEGVGVDIKEVGAEMTEGEVEEEAVEGEVEVGVEFKALDGEEAAEDTVEEDINPAKGSLSSISLQPVIKV